jgi:hypothetical protein
MEPHSPSSTLSTPPKQLEAQTDSSPDSPDNEQVVPVKTQDEKVITKNTDNRLWIIVVFELFRLTEKSRLLVYGRSTKANQKNGLKVSTESRARNLAASPARVTRVARSELRPQRKRMRTMMR